MDMASVENRQLVQRLREESLITWEKQMPALWTTRAYSVSLSILYNLLNTSMFVFV